MRLSSLTRHTLSKHIKIEWYFGIPLLQLRLMQHSYSLHGKVSHLNWIVRPGWVFGLVALFRSSNDDRGPWKTHEVAAIDVCSEVENTSGRDCSCIVSDSSVFFLLGRMSIAKELNWFLLSKLSELNKTLKPHREGLLLRLLTRVKFEIPPGYVEVRRVTSASCL